MNNMMDVLRILETEMPELNGKYDIVLFSMDQESKTNSVKWFVLRDSKPAIYTGNRMIPISKTIDGKTYKLYGLSSFTEQLIGHNVSLLNLVKRQSLSQTITTELFESYLDDFMNNDFNRIHWYCNICATIHSFEKKKLNYKTKMFIAESVVSFLSKTNSLKEYESEIFDEYKIVDKIDSSDDVVTYLNAFKERALERYGISYDVKRKIDTTWYDDKTYLKKQYNLLKRFFE